MNRKSTRRTFLMSTAASAAATSALSVAVNAHAGGSDTIKVGLIGCGGRGTGAAEQNLTPTRARSWWRWPTPSRIGWRIVTRP